MTKVYYIVEIVRDENGDVTERNIKYASNKFGTPGGYEAVPVLGEKKDVSTQRCVVDGEGRLVIEDDPAKVTAKNDEDAIKTRIARMEFGKRLIAIISIRNDSKSLTTAQITQFATDYADINTALVNGSIATAKALITALTPDGTITTQTDKDAMLDEITANETALGY